MFAFQALTHSSESSLLTEGERACPVVFIIIVLSFDFRFESMSLRSADFPSPLKALTT
ncbi:hypothetical protein D3C80_2097310 [compost metagenome]